MCMRTDCSIGLIICSLSVFFVFRFSLIWLRSALAKCNAISKNCKRKAEQTNKFAFANKQFMHCVRQLQSFKWKHTWNDLLQNRKEKEKKRKREEMEFIALIAKWVHHYKMDFIILHWKLKIEKNPNYEPKFMTFITISTQLEIGSRHLNIASNEFLCRVSFSFRSHSFASWANLSSVKCRVNAF